MSQPSATITIDQLRNREIAVTDLLRTAAPTVPARLGHLGAPVEPLSVFGRKIVGHDS